MAKAGGNPSLHPVKIFREKALVRGLSLGEIPTVLAEKDVNIEPARFPSPQSTFSTDV